MSAIEVLCEIIAQGGKARAASFRFRQGYGALLERGYLHETGVAQAIGCEECDAPHDAEVVFDGGQYGVYCPELGFLPIAREEIAAVEPDMPRLVVALAEVFGCRRRKTTPLQGDTWRIGAVPSQSGEVVLYFHPRLTSKKDALDLGTALAHEVHAPFRMILTAEVGLPFGNAKTVSLGDAIEQDGDTGAISATVDVFAIVGAPNKRVGGAPNFFGQTLRQVIKTRIETGTALEGRNEEAKAILDALGKANPDKKQPSLPTIKRYLSEFRNGS